MFVVDVAYERDVLDLSFVSPGIDFSSESGGWYSDILIIYERRHGLN